MKNQNADELLESIFYYMNQLFEKRDFTSTIEILTNLGRTLVQSDRASFWFWDRLLLLHRNRCCLLLFLYLLPFIEYPFVCKSENANILIHLHWRFLVS